MSQVTDRGHRYTVVASAVDIHCKRASAVHARNNKELAELEISDKNL